MMDNQHIRSAFKYLDHQSLALLARSGLLKNHNSLTSQFWKLINEGGSGIFVSSTCTATQSALAFVPPLTKRLKSRHKRNGSAGPFIIILEPSSVRVQQMYEMCGLLLQGSDSFSIVSLYSGHEQTEYDLLLNGVDLLVCTPACLARALQPRRGPSPISTRQCSHLVIDQVAHTSSIVDTDLTVVLRALASNSSPVQYLLLASNWNPTMGLFLNSFNTKPAVVTDSTIVAWVSAGVLPKVFECSSDHHKCPSLNQLSLARSPEQKWAVCFGDESKESKLKESIKDEEILLICDRMAESYDVGSLDHIIHFDMADTESALSNRLALLKERNIYCQTFLFDSGSVDKRMAVLLKELFCRIDGDWQQKGSQTLASALCEASESSSRPLCASVKFGLGCCTADCLCVCRHKVTDAERPLLPFDFQQIPFMAEVRLRAAGLSDEGVMYGQLISMADFHVDAKWREMNDRLTAVAEDRFMNSGAVRPQRGEEYIYKQEKSHFRVRMISSISTDLAAIESIDQGWRREANTADLRLLAPELRSEIIPPFCVQIIPVNVSPPDTDDKFAPETVEKLRRAFVGENRIVSAKVHLMLGSCIWAAQIVCLSKVGAVYLVQEQMNLLLRPNTNHTSRLAQLRDTCDWMKQIQVKEQLRDPNDDESTDDSCDISSDDGVLSSGEDSFVTD